ncbi:uncharacterized protein [Anabrus simplex]|uniref:uncharacterized protein n=1 Tax=Anabrus simplex TaxID=316456 RepID=UPI0035A37202
MLLWFTLFSIFVVFMAYYSRRDPPPILGIYKQPGKWYPIKYVIFQIILLLRRLKPSRLKGSTIDTLQPLSKHPKAFDAVFFMGTNKDGFYFVAGSERRQHGIVNGLCYLVVPGIGLLCSEKLPDTVLFGSNNSEFGAEGISLKPIQPMHKWKVIFEGKMRLLSDPTKIYNVKIDGDWVSNLPYFNFDTDLHIPALASSIARETWSKRYFNNLKEAHQTHYEQMGSMKAVISLNNDKIFNVQMQAFRDHSYGNKRDWDLMHRYAFYMLFLEDGTMASIGIICQPCTGSELQAGYVYTPEGELHPLEWCDMKLYQHGENGTPPTDQGFQFKAGPTVYTVQVNVEHQAVHYVGWNWEARMVERFVKYEVNGIPGRGVSEFHYHRSEGRPEDYSKTDPQWFQAIKYK